MSSVHRRRSSKEDADDNPVLDQNGHHTTSSSSPSTVSNLLSPSTSPARSRLHSSPSASIPARTKAPPPPLGAGIPARRPPSVSLNTPPTSPFRGSFAGTHTRAHSRTRSISSGPFVSSSMPSPLQSSFPPHVPLFPFPTSSSTPEVNVTDTSAETRLPPPGHTRRHSRLHSRNLSIFFPRPHATISEDDRPEDEEAPAPPPEPLLVPTAQSEPMVAPGRGRGELDASFTFGGVPKSESAPDNAGAGIKPRRGHHHKHSLSHNFFSFLEPGQTHLPPTAPSKSDDLHAALTPTPMSPWTPISNTTLFSASNLSVPEIIPRSNSISPGESSSLSDSQSASSVAGPSAESGVSRSGGAAAATALVQFVLGAFLWARGQSIGSLACTGLGYWVVFDAAGVAGPAITAYYAKDGRAGMYGSARRGTTFLFAQCVYLMFAGVYVAKEAVEHVLLSAGSGALAHGHGHGGNDNAFSGGGDGHHHHWGDEKPEILGLRFPVFLILLVLLSLVGTSTVFGQHDVLVNSAYIAGNSIFTNKHIPSPAELFRRHRHVVSTLQMESASAVKRLIQSPYALPPVLFCVAILGAELVLDVAHYTPFDLGLAAMQVVVTIHVAYSACVVLGGVLLQTAPPVMIAGSSGMRGSGRMEAFWRVVREIERHEHVVHLPAPHVWQVIAPGQPRSVDGPLRQEPHTYANGRDHSHGRNAHRDNVHGLRHDHQIHSSDRSPALIITLSLHVHKDLPDSDILVLTQWASSRVYGAFGYGLGKAGQSEVGEVEVTVGVVRA